MGQKTRALGDQGTGFLFGGALPNLVLAFSTRPAFAKGRAAPSKIIRLSGTSFTPAMRRAAATPASGPRAAACPAGGRFRSATSGGSALPDADVAQRLG